MTITRVVPSWLLIDCVQVSAEDPEPGVPSHGWQFLAAQAMDDCFSAWSGPTQQVMVRSQSGPLACVPITSLPTSPSTRFDAQVFRVLLLRRLWRPLPPLDPSGHHWSACAT